MHVYMYACRSPLATACLMDSSRHVRIANEATFYSVPLPSCRRTPVVVTNLFIDMQQQQQNYVICLFLYNYKSGKPF